MKLRKAEQVSELLRKRLIRFRVYSHNEIEARQWFSSAHEFLQSLEDVQNAKMSIASLSFSGVGVKKFYLKARVGRGPKRAPWKEAVHATLLEEFQRIRAAGVKVDAELLRIWCLGLLDDEEVAISRSDVEIATGKSAEEIIDGIFIKAFLRRFNIVERVRTGNKKLSEAQIQRSNRQMAFHLGQMRDAYSNGLDQRDVENYYVTHFIYDMENGRVLDFKGTKRVTYSDMSSGRDKFTVCVRVSGGPECNI